MKEVKREILLAFWKIHILHHAGEGVLHGQWMIDELREHGYAISPGTLYPLLRRMERLGWLAPAGTRGPGVRARRDYRLTSEGRAVLRLVRKQLRELCDEVMPGPVGKTLGSAAGREVTSGRRTRRSPNPRSPPANRRRRR